MALTILHANLVWLDIDR